ncbi:MAG: hypothetical protein GF411_07165 [Candidatus Lokiarchaeota archaeon]|nr:hypothetical protein [Candidatus Lokiarchaeota archaeon]
MPTKKDVLTKEMKKYIRDMLMPEIKKLDLEAWSKACKSFGPFSYKQTTRKAWFEKNKEKVPVGREILKFHDKYKSIMKKDEKLKEYKLKVCTDYMIELIREAQEDAGITSNKINSVKIATFSTLITFDEEPEKLEEGLYEGKEELPKDVRSTRSYRRGRKKEKGTPLPPQIVLDSKGELKPDEILQVTGKLVNRFIHPYQNISVTFESTPEIELKKAKGYKVVEGVLVVDFLKTSLQLEPYEVEILLEFKIGKESKAYSIETKVSYDNCDSGIRETADSQKHNVKVS